MPPETPRSPSRPHPRPSAAWLAVLLLTLLAGCDGSVDVVGRVTDASGEPVAGAEIDLGRPGESVRFDAVSGADGCFRIGGMVSPGVRDYDLTVTAAGYSPYAETISNGEPNALLVTLAEAGSGGDSGAERLGSMYPAELESCVWE